MIAGQRFRFDETYVLRQQGSQSIAEIHNSPFIGFGGLDAAQADGAFNPESFCANVYIVDVQSVRFFRPQPCFYS